MTAPADPDSPSPGLLLFRRTTCDGRNLIYRLQILQQPDRARACGAGTKAHSDRRPIDPPPVVEFRIFQGHAADDPVNSPDAKDVTFRYPANFFLFATLENARPIAHGRIVNAASQAVPVLSGMPVAGLAYLDRPIEAGYFLFPDLSVRHEGLYRLAFNLYEQTKEDRDMDEPASSVPLQNPCLADVPMSGSSSEAAFDWRMEVKSRLFRVFSAKKFPGLCESTILSRTVAEQGCRVRIRRDVRMRRRHRKYNPDHALDGDDANDPQVDDGQEGLDASDCQDHSNFADSRNGNHQMDGRLVPEIHSRLHTPNLTRARPSSTAPDRKAGMSRRLSNIRDFAIASAPYSPMSEPHTSHAEDLDVNDSRSRLYTTLAQTHAYFAPTPSLPLDSRCRQHYSRSTSLEPGFRSNTHQTLPVVSHSSAHETFFQPTSANNTDSPPACSSYPPYGNDRRRSSSLQSQTRAQSVAMTHPSQSALKPLLPPLSTITTLPYDSVPYEFGILPLDVLDAMEPQSPSAPLQHAGDKRVFDASFVDHSNMPLYDGHRPDSLAPLLTCRRSPSLLSHTPSGLHDSMISYNRNDSNVITRENSF